MDSSGVVLEEAVVAVRASEVELLGVIELADIGHDRTDGLGALHDAVHRRALDGDVVSQAVQPDRTVLVSRNANAVEASDICHAAPPTTSALIVGDMGSSSSVGNTSVVHQGQCETTVCRTLRHRP